MKKLISSLVILLSFFWGAIANSDELTPKKEQMLIKKIEQIKLQTGNASQQYLDALTELGEAYENDPARREQYKYFLVDLIKYIRAIFGESFVNVDTLNSVANMFEIDGDYDNGIKFFEEYRFSLNPQQYIDLKNRKVRNDLNLLKFAYVEINIANMHYLKGDFDQSEAIFKKYLNAFDNQDVGDVKVLHAELLSKYSNLKGDKNEREAAAKLALNSYEIIKSIPNLSHSVTLAYLNNAVSRLDLAGKTLEYNTLLNELKDLYALNKQNLDPAVKVYTEYLIRNKNDLNQSIESTEQYIKALENLPLNAQLHSELIAFRSTLSLQLLDKLQDTNLQSNQKKQIVDNGLNSCKKNILQILQNPLSTNRSNLAANLALLTIFQTYFENNPTAALQTLHLYMMFKSEFPYDLSLTATEMALLSTLYADMGEDELSIFWGKQSVNAFQAIKYNDKDLDKVYLNEANNAKNDIYPVIAEILSKNGRILEAQQVLQMLKENELYESLRGATDDPRKLQATLTSEEVDNVKNYSKLAHEELNKFRNVQFNNYSNVENASKLYHKKVEGELKFQPASASKSESNISTETLALRNAVHQLAVSEPSSKAIGIQYYVTKDNLNIIVTSSGGSTVSHQVKIDRAKFYESINKVTLQIQNPKADAKYYSPALKELYGLLITPIMPELKKYKAKTLMLSLDSQLRLLPFAALIDSNNHYLLESYTVALYNEAANQALEKPSNPKWRVAAMGLSKSVNGLKALSAVPNELAGILKTSGLEGDEYLDATFTRRQFIKVTKATDSTPYNVLHVASHFELQPSDPGESSLYMGDGTKFSLKEMSALPLNFKNFDLVTYSACQTAVTGSNDGSGKEIESLSAQTQRQGAQAVMATLWKVSDQSTAKLMQDYYAQRNQGLNKAEALRAVQLNMGLGKAGNANWKSPHHWAGFVISGNWR